MNRSFHFRIRPISLGESRRFQLTIGLQHDEEAEFIPVHRSAFAERVPVKAEHDSEVDAHIEMRGLLEWLEARPGS